MHTSILIGYGDKSPLGYTIVLTYAWRNEMQNAYNCSCRIWEWLNVEINTTKLYTTIFPYIIEDIEYGWKTSNIQMKIGRHLERRSGGTI